MRALATRFPGALRELHALDAATLRARHEAVRRALRGGPVDAWIPIAILFHRLAHEALAPGTRAPLREVWRRAGEACGCEPDAAEALLFGTRRA